jgi:uncharacterized membrane protein
MLNRIFPKQLDNNYRGQQIAVWLFALLTLMNTVISFVAIFKADGAAQSADGIPLDTFGASAAQAVIGIVAVLGLARLLLCVIFIIALIGYRAMIPLMYVLLVDDWLAHRGIGMMKPIVRAADAPGHYVTLALFSLSVIGLILSLTGKNYQQSENSAA